MQNMDYISQLNLEDLALPTTKFENNDIDSFADLSFFDFDANFNLKSSFNLNNEPANVPDVLSFNVDQYLKPSTTTPTQTPSSTTPYSPASTTTSPNPSSSTTSNTISTEHDKKKRNTAASARFRIKKKLREQEMERTLKELTEKVHAYNSKIQQLEMENSCLKSLIIEKNEKKSNDLLRSIKLKSTFTPYDRS